MWTPLNQITEFEFQRLATLSAVGADTPEYVELIRLIATRPYAHEIAVVTGLHYLSLSGQLQWEKTDHLQPCHLHLPGIAISLAPWRGICVSYSPGCTDTGDPPGPTYSRSVPEAADRIDTAVNRLFHDIPVARQRIAEARERKRTWFASQDARAPSPSHFD